MIFIMIVPKSRSGENIMNDAIGMNIISAVMKSDKRGFCITDDNIIARNALLCLLAVRMNFGVPDDFYVRQIVMGNLF